jgi:hypothetical protein
MDSVWYVVNGLVVLCWEYLLIDVHSIATKVQLELTSTHHATGLLTSITGYLTNTGIKFMILVENIHLNEDGRRQELASTSNLSPNPLNRESDLKIMFVSLVICWH